MLMRRTSRTSSVTATSQPLQIDAAHLEDDVGGTAGRRPRPVIGFLEKRRGSAKTNPSPCDQVLGVVKHAVCRAYLQWWIRQ